MNLIIPFTKDIKFKTNIAKILSVSLEHDYTVNALEVLGNFTVSGEYKVHEVSINKESFSYVLPFSVSLPNKIDESSVDFDIVNFTYEVVDNDTLRVNIEYSVNAKEVKEDIFLASSEELASLDDILDELDNRNDDKKEIEVETKEEIKESKAEEKVEEKTEEEQDNTKENKENPLQKDAEKNDERDITEEAKETILGSINTQDDTYITYHVHIMRKTDTIEALCVKYNVTENILKEYNDLANLGVKDKVIIPESYE
mgnify:CR=1 FL=1